MTNDSQHSFIATLHIPNHNLHLLGALHGQSVIVTDLLGSGGVFSGKPQLRDDSAAMGIQAHATGGIKATLKLYFRHTAKGYEIHIKHPGQYDRHRLAMNHMDILYARSPTLKHPLAFTLLDQNNRTVTERNLSEPHTLITLKTHNDKYIGVRKAKGSPHYYLGETAEHKKMVFLLNIIERNVSY